MKIKAAYDRSKKEQIFELHKNATVKDLLEKMKINPVTVIASRNNEIIAEDEKLKNNDKIKVISVISGG